MDKPRLRDRLFFALACYAAALAWVALVFVFCWTCGWLAPVRQDMRIEAGVAIWLFGTLPIPAALIGLGTGALLNRDGRGALGAMFGFALALLIQLALFFSFR